MFDSPASYKLIQVDRNRSNLRLYQRIFIYKFYIHKKDSLRKYIVRLTEFQDQLFLIDYYAKIKDGRSNDLRYNVLTNQKVTGRVGATILSIISEIAKNKKDSCFGIAAAPLKNETNDNFTKRCKVYSLILSYTTKGNSEFDLRVIKEKSHIFIIRKKFSLLKSEKVLRDYEKIFEENY